MPRQVLGRPGSLREARGGVMVVVVGGVGELLGVVFSGLGIGVLTKLVEAVPWIGTIWAKILLLIVVVIFIQFKPAGLFAPKGRLADDR